MRAHIHKIIGLLVFTVSSISMFSMQVYAATAQDYEQLGESLSGPIICILIGVAIIWFSKKK